MRGHLIALLLAALGVGSILGSSAFNYASLDGASARAVSVTITGDGAAYLKVAANAASPHDCFVQEAANGTVSILFDATDATCGANGGGQGVNAGGSGGKYAWYAFHDVLEVTNRGTKPVKVWVNVTSQAGTVQVAKKASSGTMIVTDYYPGTSATALSLSIGSSMFVGVQANSTTLTTGAIQGTLRLAARV